MANLSQWALNKLKGVVNKIDRDKQTPGFQLTKPDFYSPLQTAKPTTAATSNFKPLRSLQNKFQQAELARINYKREQDSGEVGKRLMANPLTYRGGSALDRSAKNIKRGVGSVKRVMPGGEKARKEDVYNIATAVMTPSIVSPAGFGSSVLGGGLNELLGGGGAEDFGKGFAKAPFYRGLGKISTGLGIAAGPKAQLAEKLGTGALREGFEGFIEGAIRPLEPGETRADALMGDIVFGMGFGVGLEGAGELIRGLKPFFKNLETPDDVKIDRTYVRNNLGQFARKMGVEPDKLKQQMDDFIARQNEPIKVKGMDGKVREIKRKNLGFARLGPESQVTKADINAKSKQLIETDAYIKEQVDKQAKAAGKGGFSDKLKEVKSNVTTKLGDFFAPIEDTLSKAEKEFNFKVLPGNDVRYQVDSTLRADTIGSQFIKDQGLTKVIQGVDNLDEFNQYLIAKHAAEVNNQGFKTGRNLKKDAQLVDALSEKYEPFAKEVVRYNQALLDYSVESGMVSPSLRNLLIDKYPDYVPLKRVFSEMENVNSETGSGGPASLSSQAFLKRLKGSAREIKDPLESMVEATGVVFRQGERNKTAQMLISYKDIPGNPFGLKKIKGKIGTKNAISALQNGKKVSYETTPEIAEAAKNMSAEQMNIIMKMARIPTRILQLGAVGLNAPFIVGNLVKDQVTASVLSDMPMKTSLANPLNFTRALYETLGQGKVYDDWVKSGASFTSFDIARDQAKQTVEGIRAGKSAPSKVAHTVKNPGEMLRAVEDIVGKTEEITRVQQYKGTYDALIEQGRTPQDAKILAADASRNNTANFGRRGAWSTVLNSMIPFFNAGVQGARSLARAVKKNPSGTAIRFATTMGMPVAVATMWNISDPKRKAAYDDIPEYEKENNLIILPESPEKDEKGQWKAIKIPMNPGLANLTSLVRRPIEGTQEVNFQGIQQMAGDIVTARTGVDVTSGRKFASSIIPQALKPGIESLTNTNLYTGNDIVPFYMKQKPKEEQVYKNTSGTVRLIAKAMDASPLVVQNAINTTTAGTGRQILRASDNMLHRAGVIPEEQIGGESIGENIQRRFTRARGGQLARTEGTKEYAIKEYKLPIVASAEASKGKSQVLTAKQKVKELKAKEDAWKKSVKVIDDENLSEKDKSELIRDMGLDREAVDYYYLVSQSASVREELVMDTASGIDDHVKRLAYLANGRREINGKRLITNTLISTLVDEGIITYNEGKELKKIDYDPNKQQLRVKQSGRGSGAKYKLKVSLTPISSLISAANKGKTSKQPYKLSKSDIEKIQL